MLLVLFFVVDIMTVTAAPFDTDIVLLIVFPEVVNTKGQGRPPTAALSGN